jgi:hypothetical protein
MPRLSANGSPVASSPAVSGGVGEAHPIGVAAVLQVAGDPVAGRTSGADRNNENVLQRKGRRP